MVLIPVVDENDTIIGHKERSEIGSTDIYRVSGLWIVNAQWEMLLAQRAFVKDYDPGKWWPSVGGTVEKGESYEETIIRETEEEIGLKDFPIHTLFKKRRMKSDRTYFVQFFFAEINKPITEFILKKDEVEQIKWISKEDLLAEIDKHPDDFLSAVKEYVWYPI